jgi:hypothetical protein
MDEKSNWNAKICFHKSRTKFGTLNVTTGYTIKRTPRTVSAVTGAWCVTVERPNAICGLLQLLWKIRGIMVESYFQHGVKNIWWSVAQAHRGTGYPARRGRTQVYVHSGGLTDTHVCAQNSYQIVIAHWPCCINADGCLLIQYLIIYLSL